MERNPYMCSIWVDRKTITKMCFGEFLVKLVSKLCSNDRACIMSLETEKYLSRQVLLANYSFLQQYDKTVQQTRFISNLNVNFIQK